MEIVGGDRQGAVNIKRVLIIGSNTAGLTKKELFIGNRFIDLINIAADDLLSAAAACPEIDLVGDRDLFVGLFPRFDIVDQLKSGFREFFGTDRDCRQGRGGIFAFLDSVKTADTDIFRYTNATFL